MSKDLSSDLNAILDYYWNVSSHDLDSCHRPFEGTYDRLKDREGYYEQYQDRLFKHNLASEVVFDDKDEHLKKYINSLSHIPMSPNRKDLFEKFYVIDNENTDHILNELGIKKMVTRNFLSINNNKKRVDSFVKLLIKEAKKLVHYQNDQDISFAKYVIVGKPGTGKTAFINYLFSMHSDKLDEEKIIYTRVNLNDVSQESSNLKTRMLSKWLRIFSKYYFGNNRVKDFEDSKNVIKEIKSRLRKAKKKYHFADYSDQRFSMLIDYFVKKLYKLQYKTFKEYEFNLTSCTKPIINGEDPITLDDLLKFTELTMSYVQSVKNWGNIFIFDGFDRMSFDKIQRDLFQSWCNQMKELTSIKDNQYCKSVFLITLRDTSINSFFYNNLQDTQKKINSDKGPWYRVLTVEPCTLEEVIVSRFNFLAEKYETLNSNNIMRNIINLLYMCYTKKSPEESLSSSWKDVSKELADLFAYNYRICFKFLRDLLETIYRILCEKENVVDLLQSPPENMELMKAFQGQEWQIMNLLVAGTSKIQPFKNRNTYGENGQPEYQHVVPIIPNIFNFNEYAYNTIESRCLSALELAKNEFSLGISANEQENKLIVKYLLLKIIEKTEGAIGVETLIKSMNVNFCKNWKYDLIYEIRELIFSNILSCKKDEAVIQDSLSIMQNYEIKLTRKYAIIDKILNQSIYYENVLLDTPIERRFKGSLRPLSKYDRSTTWDYLKEKTTHIIYFINYIKIIQDRMLKIIPSNRDHNERLYIISKTEFQEDFMLMNTDRENEIRKSILSYLSGYLKNHSEDKVRNLIYRWQEEIEKDKVRRETNIAQ
jgi:hypothetical protein